MFYMWMSFHFDSFLLVIPTAGSISLFVLSKNEQTNVVFFFKIKPVRIIKLHTKLDAHLSFHTLFYLPDK